MSVRSCKQLARVGRLRPVLAVWRVVVSPSSPLYEKNSPIIFFFHLFPLGISSKHYSETLPVCCERGCLSYTRGLVTQWQEQFLSSGLSSRQIYSRTEATWNFLSVLGALLCSMGFLSFQKVRMYMSVNGRRGGQPEKYNGTKDVPTFRLKEL